MSNPKAYIPMTTAETKQIQIVVNGEDRTVPAGSSLLEALKHLGVEPDRVAVEMDRSIVRKQVWPVTFVEPGTQLEIVQFVGGG